MLPKKQTTQPKPGYEPIPKLYINFKLRTVIKIRRIWATRVEENPQPKERKNTREHLIKYPWDKEEIIVTRCTGACYDSAEELWWSYADPACRIVLIWKHDSRP